ncbi:MAG: hypothetical protein IPG50_37880 [Myxococcales bacterium]|nr:hypothetical protein [Myxococcales bacterium]
MRAAVLVLACSVGATTACGIVAFSTDSLTGGGEPSSTNPASNRDADITSDASVGSDSSVGDAAVPLPDSTTPPASDGAVLPDGASAVGCPANPCGPGNVCCYVKQSPTSGDFVCQPTCPTDPVDCAGPQQCGTAAPLCCARVGFGPGSLPNCPIEAVVTKCAASCTTNFALSCNVNNTMRLCHEKADCASDPQNKNCCTYIGTGVSSIVCVSDLIRDVAGLLCVP